MKMKKLLSALLATALVFAMTCTPAFAAGRADTLADINRDDSIWVGVTYLDALAKEITVRTQNWSANGSTITKNADASDPYVIDVYELPLGVTLAAGPNNEFLRNVWVYTDADGDGIYDERIEKITWADDDTAIGAEVIPVSSNGPFTMTDSVGYYNTFDWGYGHNSLEASLNDLAGYHTVTTDYLVEKFGANTLIQFCDEAAEYYHGFLLTGKAAPEGVLYPLEAQGVYFTQYGELVSGWAVEPVNAAVYADLLPYSVEEEHSFDLTGNITRAQFAAVAVKLYEAMSGQEALYTDADPFVDVKAGTISYQYIMAARDLGIVQGTSTTAKTFEPNALVSRQDAALMLSRVYTKLGGTLPAGTTAFADNGNIAGYAMNAVAFMSSKGIINGVGNNRFDPKGNASVEQALKIALEMLNKLDV